MAARVDKEQGRADGPSEEPVLVTGPEAATLAGVEPATIRRWKARGKLAPVDKNARGENLYTLPDVFAVQRGEDPRTHWRHAAT